MKALIIESLDSYTKITLNRPKVLNALNTKLFEELLAVFQDDSKKTHGLIIAANGEKAFCAGADIKELKKMKPQEVQNYLTLANSTIDALEQYSKPTIGVLHGYVLGGGLELATACDFLIAEENAIFGMPETKLGLIPGFNGVKRLQKRIGIQRTKELVYSGRTITAHEALSYKLVDLVVKKEFLETMVIETLKSFSHNPNMVSLAKKSFYTDNTDALFIEAFKTWVKS